MKKLLLFFSALLFCGIAFAQAPQAINYQAVARDAGGAILSNQAVSFRLSILAGGPGGSAVYEETHALTTNGFGLANLQVGGGTVVSGNFSTIDWGGNSHFLQVEMDPSGGSSYVLMGTSELLSVPYALHAETVAQDSVMDDDADPNNEIQSLSLSGDSLSISGGNTVLLTGDQDWTVSGNDMSSIPTGNVGIGTASPAEKLHVGGNLRVDALAGTGNGIVTTDANGSLSRLDFTGSTSQYLRADGTWGTVSGGGSGTNTTADVRSIWTLSTDYVVNTSWVQIYSYGTNGGLRIENPSSSTYTIKYSWSTNNGSPTSGNLSPGQTLDITSLQSAIIDIRCSRYSITTDQLHCTFLGMGMSNGHIRGHVFFD